MSENIFAQVSVVIPCYCCEKTIARAVESVSNQTLLPYELILIDDNSTDNTLKELHRLKDIYPVDWIKIISLTENCGPGTARNKGWEAATQTYIAFLDADDSWHPYKIEIQYTWMSNNTSVVLTGHNCKVLTQENHKTANIKFIEPTLVEKRKLFISNQFSTPTIMLKRDLPLRFVEEKKYAEDYLLWLEIMYFDPLVYKFNLDLAFLHKKRFGDSGLSAQLWNMEKGELDSYYRIYKKKLISPLTLIMISSFSFVKYIRRLFKSTFKQ